MKKLAIITTHPIQYNAPLFKLIAKRKKIQIKVFYTWENSKDKIFDKKFGKEIKWDIPLLEGYEYIFVKNTAKIQGSHNYKGITNPTLNKEIKNWQADAILVYGWKFHSHYRALKYFKGKIPVFFRGDSTLLDQNSNLKTFIRQKILTFVYRKIDFAFYVGKNNKQYFLKHGLTEKQLIFAPHAIDNERFTGISDKFEKQAIDWREKLGYNNTDIVFLFVGKFEPKKNPLLLIEAAKQVQKFKFLFVGNGELENEMKQNAENYTNIQFLPFQNQSKMPVIYRLGNVYVLPSAYNETWGLAVNEAMACQKPVLVSNKVGCAIDLINTNKNGFVFKSNDLLDLINKTSLFNLKNIKLFGKNSLSIIENWSFELIAKVIEKKCL